MGNEEKYKLLLEDLEALQRLELNFFNFGKRYKDDEHFNYITLYLSGSRGALLTHLAMWLNHFKKQIEDGSADEQN